MDPLTFGDSDEEIQNDFSDDSNGEQEESLANPFLSAVEESDRPIVEKYIKDWDAGVTKKFQEIHSTYQPYKDLGADPETLGSAMQLFMALNSDPIGTLEILQEGYKDYMGEFDDNSGQPDGGTVHSVPEFEGLPPQAAEYIKGLESQLSEVHEFMQESRTEKQEQQEMAQLDKTLSDMHNKHGDFDEDYVLVQLANGYPPEKAIERYNQFVEKVVSSRNKKPAPKLPGVGSLPSGQVDASKIKGPTDRKALVAQILASSQEG